MTQGTWEQIVALAPSLAGHRPLLTILPQTDDANPSAESELLLLERFMRIRCEAPDAWEALPADLAEQHDHYLYGWPMCNPGWGARP